MIIILYTLINNSMWNNSLINKNISLHSLNKNWKFGIIIQLNTIIIIIKLMLVKINNLFFIILIFLLILYY